MPVTVEGGDYLQSDTSAIMRGREEILIRERTAVSLAGPIFTIDTKRLEAIIAKFGPAAEVAIQKAIFKLAQETRDRMRKDAPKKTGALAASIYVSATPNAVDQANGVSAANSKAATIGYFRAIQAASKLSANKPKAQWAGTAATRAKILQRMSRLTILGAEDDVYQRTQRSSRFLAAPATHIASRIKFNAYNESTDEDLGFGSFLPMALGSRNSFFITIGAAAYYAGLVEFGTVKARAQPFFVPNMNWARSQVEGRVVAAIEGVQMK